MSGKDQNDSEGSHNYICTYVHSSAQLVPKVCVCMRYILLISMHQAIEMGDKNTIAHWLKKEKENVNICRGGSTYHQHIAVANGTALHWAAYYGQLEIAQLLLDNGAGISNCHKLLKFKDSSPYIS